MIYQKLIEIEKRQAVFEERFKQIDRRFAELREDMNRRFEQVDKRFEEQLRIFKWIGGVFTAMVIGFISLLIWDRRSAMRAAVKEA